MGRQLIRQPDGLYAVFSTGVDCWVAVNLTRDQYIEWRVERAAREARESAARLLDDTDAGLVYAGYTFEEANAESVKHGGEDLSGKLATPEPDEKFRQQAAEFMDRNDELLRRLATGGDTDG